MNKEEETGTSTEDLETLKGEEPEGAHEAGGEVDPGTGEALNPESEGDGNEVEVSIGGEPDPQAEEERKAPQWVRDLRKQTRDLARENKELKAKLATPATETKPVVGPKPKLEDFDYDAEKFEKELTTWFETKRKADQEEQRRKDAAQAEKVAWETELQRHEKAKDEFRTKVKDFDESEEVATSILDGTQLGLVIHLCDNSALVLHALGTNPGEAKRLSEIKDYPKFVKELTKLEAQVKVTPRKTKPEPERMPSSTNRGAGGAVDSQLERLREEAARTGDYSKVHAYKTQKRKS